MMETYFSSDEKDYPQIGSTPLPQLKKVYSVAPIVEVQKDKSNLTNRNSEKQFTLS